MSRIKNEFLGWFAFTYISIVLIFFSIGTYEKHPMISALVIFIFSIFTTYGILVLWRDLKLFGWKWIAKTFRDFFEKLSE